MNYLIIIAFVCFIIHIIFMLVVTKKVLEILKHMKFLQETTPKIYLRIEESCKDKIKVNKI